VGNNVVEIKVTAEDGTVKTYTVTVVRAASSDATLSKLTVSTGILSFDPAITSYTVNVLHEVTSISVTGTANHAQATVEGNVTGKTLSIGNNLIGIIVTAEDDLTTKIYEVMVIRNDHVLVTEANLIGVTLNSKPVDVDNFEYIVNCDDEFLALNLQTSPYSNVKVNNLTYVPGQRIDITNDVTTVNIQVTAETGGAENSYSLKIIPPINENKLYYQRWDDVIAINLNPANNGNITVSGVRWYKKDGTFVPDEYYVSIGDQSSVSDWYAEILTDNEWRRVCGVPVKRSEQVVAYPNPVPRGESVKILMPETFVGGTLNIYNINGTLQKSGIPLSATNIDVNVSNLSPGIYLLHISGTHNDRHITKIIIE
jgi:hypothetical protein